MAVLDTTGIPLQGMEIRVIWRPSEGENSDGYGDAVKMNFVLEKAQSAVRSVQDWAGSKVTAVVALGVAGASSAHAALPDGVETATAGIADALTLTAEGRPAVVVDWKSDVTPAPGTLDHYRAQVRAYLDMTGAERGLIVLMTSGTVIPVLPTKPTESEAA